VHGCKQSFDNIGETFVRHAGYNEWADTNRIIILYPQTWVRGPRAHAAGSAPGKAAVFLGFCSGHR
ncbi:MAG TPA: hypothetical protein VI279_17105, partial [Rhodocyclaceae bacterium]